MTISYLPLNLEKYISILQILGDFLHVFLLQFSNLVLFCSDSILHKIFDTFPNTLLILEKTLTVHKWNMYFRIILCSLFWLLLMVVIYLWSSIFLLICFFAPSVLLRFRECNKVSDASLLRHLSFPLLDYLKFYFTHFYVQVLCVHMCAHVFRSSHARDYVHVETRGQPQVVSL